MAHLLRQFGLTNDDTENTIIGLLLIESTLICHRIIYHNDKHHAREIIPGLINLKKRRFWQSLYAHLKVFPNKVSPRNQSCAYVIICPVNSHFINRLIVVMLIPDIYAPAMLIILSDGTESLLFRREREPSLRRTKPHVYWSCQPGSSKGDVTIIRPLPRNQRLNVKTSVSRKALTWQSQSGVPQITLSCYKALSQQKYLV